MPDRMEREGRQIRERRFDCLNQRASHGCPGAVDQRSDHEEEAAKYLNVRPGGK
jgi:hypothetical protein